MVGPLVDPVENRLVLPHPHHPRGGYFANRRDQWVDGGISQQPVLCDER